MFKLHLITHPTFFEGELAILTEILKHYDILCHIRKPEATEEAYRHFVLSIPEAYYSKIVLHSAYELAKSHSFAGIHYSTAKRKANVLQKDSSIHTSCHSIYEVNDLYLDYCSCFLSPIFDSISKEGYKAGFNTEELQKWLSYSRNRDIIALGGIRADNIVAVQRMGFDGAAVLGTVWGNNPKIEDDFLARIHTLLKSIEQPYVMSIAGFDPSAGAGVLSDVKTMEQHGCYAFGINTANTYQNADDFLGLDWCSHNQIYKQLYPLLDYPIKVIKIGLIESFDFLVELVTYLRQNFPDVFIIWDPILQASSGFDFHSETPMNKELLQMIDLITPNADEYEQLQLCAHTSNNYILLKGGHREAKRGVDTLFHKKESIDIKGVPFDDKKDKHGTGCVLSSAIAANIAFGYNVTDAVTRGKQYVESFINSNNGRLGWHQ